ncbi:MAG: hypothetical protein ACLFPF_02435 [Halanaerobiales bacterium]
MKLKLRLYTSLFIALLIYTITVIVGLINRFNLFDIFVKGLLFSVISGVFVWFLVFLLEYMAERNEENKDNSQKTEKGQNRKKAEQSGKKLNEQSNGQSDVGENNSSENFSPLAPPVLEVSEQEVERGEGN